MREGNYYKVVAAEKKTYGKDIALFGYLSMN
jgi:hypothetical protein